MRFSFLCDSHIHILKHTDTATHARISAQYTEDEAWADAQAIEPSVHILPHLVEQAYPGGKQLQHAVYKGLYSAPTMVPPQTHLFVRACPRGSRTGFSSEQRCRGGTLARSSAAAHADARPTAAILSKQARCAAAARWRFRLAGSLAQARPLLERGQVLWLDRGRDTARPGTWLAARAAQARPLLARSQALRAERDARCSAAQRML